MHMHTMHNFIPCWFYRYMATYSTLYFIAMVDKRLPCFYVPKTCLLHFHRYIHINMIEGFQQTIFSISILEQYGCDWNDWYPFHYFSLSYINWYLYYAWMCSVRDSMTPTLCSTMSPIMYFLYVISIDDRQIDRQMDGHNSLLYIN